MTPGFSVENPLSQHSKLAVYFQDGIVPGALELPLAAEEPK